MHHALTGGMCQTCASWLTRSASGAARSRYRLMRTALRRHLPHGARVIQRGRRSTNGPFWEVVFTLNARCAVISFYCLRPICGEPKGVGPEMMMCPYCEGERPHNPDNCPNCGESPPPPPPKAKPKPEFVFRSTRGRHEPKA